MFFFLDVFFCFFSPFFLLFPVTFGSCFENNGRVKNDVIFFQDLGVKIFILDSDQQELLLDERLPQVTGFEGGTHWEVGKCFSKFWKAPRWCFNMIWRMGHIFLFFQRETTRLKDTIFIRLQVSLVEVEIW